MKKLLVLMLILATASAANASISLSINGQPNPGAITLVTSQTITLDITIGDTQYMGGDLEIVVTNPQGALDTSGMTTIATPVTRLYMFGSWVQGAQAWESGAWQTLVDQPQDVIISGGNINWNTVGPYTLMDGLVFHCEEATEVMINLVAASKQTYLDHDETGGNLGPHDPPLYAQGAIIDSIHVTQIIPEPMTIVLLGLGGLFLRRRK